MPHEIVGNGIDGVDRVLLGENKLAWHGLGIVKEGFITLEDVREHLGWGVDVEPIYFQGENGEYFQASSEFSIIVRTDLPLDDSNRVLSTCGARYTPVQNLDLIDVMADILEANKEEMTFVTAGSLKAGKIVWFLTRINDQIEVMDDKIDPFLLFKSSHDGSASVQGCVTPVRVVCNNTLTLAFRAAKGEVKFKHTPNSELQLKQAARILGLSKDYMNVQAQAMQKLAEASITESFVKVYLEHLFPAPKKRSSRAERSREQIRNLFLGGEMTGYDQEACRGTAYGLFNATTEYIDHIRKSRRVGINELNEEELERSTAENRMLSTLWGSGANLRQKAFDILNEGIGTGEFVSSVVAGAENKEEAERLIDSQSN